MGEKAMLTTLTVQPAVLHLGLTHLGVWS